MNRLKIPVIFTLCILILSLSCGIEELLYLPQVPESWITPQDTSSVSISLPPLTDISYATGYIIYYKIYIISTAYNTIPELITNNPGTSRIASDYNSFKTYIDPTNTSSIPSLNTFKGKGFYELELEKSNIRNTVLSTSGGSFNIQFPTRNGEPPFIDTPDNYIYRSTDGGAFNPKPTGAGYRYFFSSPEMNDYANAIPTINADVSGQSGVSEFAYVSMYIVAVGTQQNKGNFSRLYGKPTFIGVFKLPAIN
jgi:hypothetical protein